MSSKKKIAGALFEGGEGIESAFGISAMAVNKNRHTDLTLSKKYIQVYKINVDDDLWDVHTRGSVLSLLLNSFTYLIAK